MEYLPSFQSWLFLTGLVGLVMLFARTGPSEAASNLSKWAELSRLPQAFSWLRTRIKRFWLGSFIRIPIGKFVRPGQRWVRKRIGLGRDRSIKPTDDLRRN
jgi:hypothetical protein